MMRVLLVAHGLPPVASGGTEIYVEALAEELGNAGDDVALLVREEDRERREYSLRRESRGGLSIGWINQTYREARSFRDTYAGDAVVAAARPWLDEIQPDIVHVHHLTHLSVKLLAEFARRRWPIVLTAHDFWLICHRGQLLDRDLRLCSGPLPAGCVRCLGDVAAPATAYRAASWLRRRAPWLRFSGRVPAGRDNEAMQRSTSLERALLMQEGLRLVDLVLAPSRAIEERFSAFGVPEARLRRHELGIELRRFRCRRRAPDGILRLGFFGALQPSKAPHVLLQACARLPAGRWEARLFGAFAPYHGDDQYREVLQPLLEQPGVSLRRIAHRDVPAELAELDVVVVPSIWQETSLVAREAFASGVPVVASAIGGVGELVEDGRSGLLVPPGDPEALRKALTRLLDEPGLLDRLRADIPQVRDLQDDVESTRAAYREIVARAADRGRPRLAAVVLDYRTPHDAVLAVRALQASRRPIDEVLLVENSIGDDPAHVGSLTGSAERLDTGSNLGYSGGMNHGLHRAIERGAELLLLQNADVIVPPDAVSILEAALLAEPTAGIAGPLILARSEVGRVASAGMSFSPRSGRMRHQGFGGTPGTIPASTRQVDAVEGSVMLVRREVFEKIGLFDERYFFGFEDLDLCLRARRAGFATLLVGGARAYHEGGASLPSTAAIRLYYGTRNQLLVSRDADPGAATWRRAGRFVSVVALNVAHALLSSEAPRAAGVIAVAAGARDDWRRRYGQKK